jgi:hypothetical protein
MAGEGSIMGAIQSLKNNRALRKNDRNKWKDLIGNNKENSIEDHIKASPELLLEIKTRLQKRNRINKIIQIISLILFFTIFAYIIYYLENNT